MKDKYFYIICRDGQIIEVSYNDESFNAVFNAMADKGIFRIKDMGLVLNGVDISKVLKEDQYDAWISSTTPKEYIKDGAWRDGKARKVIRYEKWKQDEIDSRAKLEAPQELELSSEEIKKKLKEYRPKFIQEWMEKNRSVVPPHDPELTANAKKNLLT